MRLFRDVIDALSADSDYTSLLKLLQHAHLIQTLSGLNGSTFFAPTNDAIERHPSWSEALTTTYDVHPMRDDVQQKLRQDLLYHILNYSVQVLPEDNNLQVHKTLYFPDKESKVLSHEHLPNSPILSVPGGSLGGEPQRLRMSSKINEVLIGSNAFGEGGSRVIKGEIDAGNAMLFGIDAVLQIPPDLASVVSRLRSVSYFNRIINSDTFTFLSTTPELTLFLPVDSAWGVLSDIDRKYLESKFATDDIRRIFNVHTVVGKGVHWSDTFRPMSKLSTLSGSTLEIITSPESGKIFVSTAELVEPDIYASNGVLHTVSSLLFNPRSLNITPEKYLLTLNCTTFVSKLRSVGLTSLINDTMVEYTILAFNDKALEHSGVGGLPEEGTNELKQALSYHFLPGKWSSKNLRDGALLETVLEEDGLNGSRQVLEVAFSSDHNKHNKTGRIQFGNAYVVGDFYEFENTVIYLISCPLVPPSDPLTTALPSPELFQYLAAVFWTSLADRLKTRPRTTFLMPVNDGFKRLGTLVNRHLLSDSSKADLENVIQYHVLNGVQYAQSLRNGSQKYYRTLEGSNIHMARPNNGSVSMSASGGWLGMCANVSTENLLTRTGVIHELSDVLFPQSVNLTIGKLVEAADGTTMASLIVRAGMDWILNGTAPPEGSPWADAGVDGVGWTVLCPTDDAFESFNLTDLFSDSDALRNIVEQHLIPTRQPTDSDLSQTDSPIFFDDGATYTTIRSDTFAFGDIVFHWSGKGSGNGGIGYLVSVMDVGGKVSKARVLSRGRTTSNGGIGGVIQIDTVLVPYSRPWWLEYITWLPPWCQKYLRLCLTWGREYGTPIAVGIIGLVLIGLFLLGICALWQCISSIVPAFTILVYLGVEALCQCITVALLILIGLPFRGISIICRHVKAFLVKRIFPHQQAFLQRGFIRRKVAEWLYRQGLEPTSRSRRTYFFYGTNYDNEEL